jgi:hypothetical protein
MGFFDQREVYRKDFKYVCLHFGIIIELFLTALFHCCFFRIQKVLRLLVASADGTLYVYNLDTNEGGDCTLLKQYRFVVFF